MHYIIHLTVRTNAPKTKITKQEGNHLRMDVHAPPENNRANVEIIKFLTKYYDKDVRILKGKTSRKKTVLLTERT